MAIPGFKIIGESLNDSVPSTNKLYVDEDIEGIRALAKLQADNGATYIDVNVGSRDAAFMARIVKEVQSVTDLPLSIDTPSFELAKAGLDAYDQERAGGKKPILNSISPLRLEMFDLYKMRPFRPILLITERDVDGKKAANHTAQDTYDTAKFMIDQARQKCDNLPNDEVIFDPGVAPIGSDTEGLVRMAVETLQMMHADDDLRGFHASGGLSNLTVMLPPKRPDGSPVKSALESAFITKCMPYGFDMSVASVRRKLELLEPDHPAMQCIEDVLKLEGHDTVMRVMEFYMS